jgi:polysaccharide biosynthesis protein PslH
VDAAVYFAHSIWPKIAPVRERLKFVVVGARPTPEVMALGNELRVQVTGTVDDVRPYYRNALAVVVPLRVGSGTRLKVLEAMAAGVPVVSTSLGAEGLAVETGKNILIQDTPEGMARVLLQLNEGTPEWKELVSNARSLVTEHYDWAVSGLVLQAIHRDLSVKS